MIPPSAEYTSRREGAKLDIVQTTSGGLCGRRVGVVGLGYVGIATALSFADAGAEVIGFDVSETRLSSIKDFRIDLLPRDRPRLSRALDEQVLRMTTEPSSIADAEFVVICVPTPIDSHSTPDLTALSAACSTVVENVRRGQVIVLTSTTYAGCTTDLLVKPLQTRGFRVGEDVFVAFSPERIDPGVADHAPERTPRVVGGYTQVCADRASVFLSHTAGVLHSVSSPAAAELTKLLENTFRAVNIALVNEFADAARDLNIDIVEVVEAAATKPYGFMAFFPGPGVGGHCIPCDPHYLLWQLRARRVNSPIVDAAMNAIAARPRVVVTRAQQILGDQGKPMRRSKILVIGVSYKPGVGDVRESPALEIIDALTRHDVDVSYSDPHVDAIRTPVVGEVFSVESPGSHDWDLVIVHTVHPNVDLSWLVNQPAVLDATYKLRLPGVHAL